MNDFSTINGVGSSEQSVETGFKKYMVKVFLWMFLGLGITTVTSVVLNVGALSGQSWSYSLIESYQLLVLIELLVVIGLSFLRNKISTGMALVLFFAYAILNGLTIGTIVLMFAASSTVGFQVATQAFLLATITFGVMAVYGYFTKTDLTKLGGYLMIGLIMLVVTSFVNILVGSSSLDFFICIAGLFLFIGVTAWDVQRIKKQYVYYAAHGSESDLNKSTILSALSLYLDFINIFLYLLRLGSRNN